MPEDHAPSPQPPPRPATHVLATSSTMLGVTTTLIGLIKLLETQTRAYSVDEMTGFVVVMFLLAAVFSYASIRMDASTAACARLERVADAVFILGLGCLGFLSAVFAWDVL